MASGVPTTVVILAAIVLTANQIFMLAVVMRTYRPERLPEFPASAILAARRRAISARLLRLASYGAVGGIVLTGPEYLVPLAIMALAMSAVSIYLRPNNRLLETRMPARAREQCVTPPTDDPGPKPGT